MISESISIFQTVLDWLQEKLKTKFGFFVLGTAFSFFITFAFLYNQLKFVDELNDRNSALRDELEASRRQCVEWQERWAASENGSMQKIEQMMSFLSKLEEAYGSKGASIDNDREEIIKQLDELKSISDRLDKIEKSKAKANK